MATEAEAAHVGKVALAATFCDGDDVVGIPQVAADSPEFFELTAGLVIELALVLAKRFGVDAAEGANAAVAGEDLGTEIAGVGAQFPFVDAGFAAKGEAAVRNGGAAPAAETTTALANPATWLRAARAHTRNS